LIIVEAGGLGGELLDNSFVDQIGRHLLSPFLTMLKLIQNLSVILADRRRMAAERRNLNVHERKERQTGKDVVQFLWVGHIEYADIRVPTGHSPQVTPDTRALQVLCASTFRLLQRLGLLGGDVVRDPHIHFDPKQHGYEPVLRLANT
jgi:hypothetical protein